MGYYTDRKKADGMGAAHAGTEHFIQQRLSAIALIPLLIMFLFLVAPLIGEPVETVKAGFQNYWVSLTAAASLIVVGIHTTQGLQVVIEDYISHQGWRAIILVLLKVGMSLLVFAGFWAIASLAFG